MSRPLLKLATAALSPEREQLAAAIVDATTVRAALDEARARAEAARGALAAAVEAVPAAERAAETAKADIVANPHGPRSVLREARAKVAEAVDDLDIARSVAERIEADLVEAERDDRYASERVEAAADAVLVSAYDATIQAAERAAKEAAALAFSAHRIAESGNAFNGERQSMTTRAAILNPHFAFGRDGSAVEAARQAAEAPWRAARAALLADPAAPLPEVP